jgi:hypothetical protein
VLEAPRGAGRGNEQRLVDRIVEMIGLILQERWSRVRTAWGKRPTWGRSRHLSNGTYQDDRNSTNLTASSTI